MKPIQWTSISAKDLEKITRFYIKLYGKTKANKIATDLRKSTEILLRENPESSGIGQVDEAFDHLQRTYRKLTNHYFKIT